MELKKSPNSLESKIEALITPTIASLGYELIDVEYQPKSQGNSSVLRLFIDNTNGKPISFEDCITVDHGLDSQIESAEFNALLPQDFALEVSSPGLDRPLKKAADFQRYEGNNVQIKTYRVLSLEEMGNPTYFQHHQKQKNFFGILRGLSGEAVQLETDNQTFFIPFSLITKANLDIASKISVDNAND